MGHEFVRVTDDVRPRREYTINALSLLAGVHKVLDKPACGRDGVPLPTKHYPEELKPAASVEQTPNQGNHPDEENQK